MEDARIQGACCLGDKDADVIHIEVQTLIDDCTGSLSEMLVDLPDIQQSAMLSMFAAVASFTLQHRHEEHFVFYSTRLGEEKPCDRHAILFRCLADTITEIAENSPARATVLKVAECLGGLQASAPASEDTDRDAGALLTTTAQNLAVAARAPMWVGRCNPRTRDWMARYDTDTVPHPSEVAQHIVYWEVTVYSTEETPRKKTTENVPDSVAMVCAAIETGLGDAANTVSAHLATISQYVTEIAPHAQSVVVISGGPADSRALYKNFMQLHVFFPPHGLAEEETSHVMAAMKALNDAQKNHAPSTHSVTESSTAMQMD